MNAENKKNSISPRKNFGVRDNGAESIVKKLMEKKNLTFN